MKEQRNCGTHPAGQFPSWCSECQVILDAQSVPDEPDLSALAHLTVRRAKQPTPIKESTMTTTFNIGTAEGDVYAVSADRYVRDEAGALHLLADRGVEARSVAMFAPGCWMFVLEVQKQAG